MLHSVRLVYQTEAGPKLAQFQQTKQSWSSEVVVTGMLEKNVYAGVEALLAEIASQLSAEANKSVQQTTVRRRRRGTSGTGRPRTEARPQPKPSQWPSPFLVSCPSYVMICSNITQFTHCSPKAILIYIYFFKLSDSFRNPSREEPLANDNNSGGHDSPGFGQHVPLREAVASRTTIIRPQNPSPGHPRRQVGTHIPFYHTVVVTDSALKTGSLSQLGVLH